MVLGHESAFTRAGILQKRLMIREAQQAVTTMGLSDVDVREPAYRINVAARQAVEIARASLLPERLGLQSSFVLLDEPTTGLTLAEVGRLLEMIRRLRAGGVGVVFVSHRLEEVLAVCDRLYVLKDGAVVAESKPSETNEAALHRAMVGRERDADLYLERRKRTLSPRDAPVLEVERLSASGHAGGGSGAARNVFEDVSLSVRAGEIVGIGGLMGSGKSELLRTIAGVHPTASGTIRMRGRPLSGTIVDRKKQGLAFVPQDRGESVMRAFTVAGNISLSSGEAGPVGFSTRLGVWKKAAEAREARQAIERYQIKAAPRTRVMRMSGGNQQKVALARWIRRKPSLLMIDNPTAGVDVGAKFEIYRILRDLADSDTAVLYVTDDLPELLGLSQRILVMRNGRIGREFDATGPGKPSEHTLVSEMIGGEMQHGADSLAGTPAPGRPVADR
jgi:simple sugar transport system ATP-binding protein/ribose transport system ATP-binding protein